MEKLKQLYSGKAKSLFATDDPNILIALFRDDTSAFDGAKVEQLTDKGMVNNHFNAHIMQEMEKGGIKTHFVKLLNDTESAVKRLMMFPIECVVRNIAAGSLCRRLGVEEGIDLNPPIFEFFLKNDELHDPMITASHIESFGWATIEDVKTMKELTLQANKILKNIFESAGMILVDYKLEFGKDEQGNIILADEITPDSCRIWDAKTRTKLDKDRFRQDLGGVIDGYKEVANRIGVSFEQVCNSAD